MGDYVKEYTTLYGVTLRLGNEYSDLPDTSEDVAAPTKSNSYGQSILAICSDGTVLDSSNQQITGKCWILQHYLNYISGSLHNALSELDDKTEVSSWNTREQAKLTELFKLFGFVYNKNKLLNPGDILINGNNLYISDTYNHRILLFDLNTSIVSVYAGRGVNASDGINGSWTEIGLSYPRGLGIDVYNQLYIADSGNNRIIFLGLYPGSDSQRAYPVAGSGTAGYSGDGGSATSAMLNTPTDVYVDSNANIFIADSKNHRIRFVNRGSNIISTFAGTGTSGSGGDTGFAGLAQLNTPTGITFGSTGLYIADSGNNKIRFVNSGSLNYISTFAGTGTAGYTGDGGLAINAQLNTPTGITSGSTGLYIADSVNNKIRFVNFSTGNISTLAGTGVPGFLEGKLNAPSAVALDSSGNLFIADTINNHIRKLTGTTLTTIL